MPIPHTAIIPNNKERIGRTIGRFVEQNFADLVNDLLTSNVQRARINTSINRLLAHPDAQAWFKSVWSELCQTALDDLAQPISRLRLALEKSISIVAQALATDEVMQRHIDDVVEHLAQSLIVWARRDRRLHSGSRAQLGYAHLFDRLELVVGSDLQYIRVNGTIVGACAGCLIFTLVRVLGQGVTCYFRRSALTFCRFVHPSINNSIPAPKPPTSSARKNNKDI